MRNVKKRRCAIFGLRLQKIEKMAIIRKVKSFNDVIQAILRSGKKSMFYVVWKNCPIVVDPKNATVASLNRQFQRRKKRMETFEQGRRLAAEFVEKGYSEQRVYEHWRTSPFS